MANEYIMLNIDDEKSAKIAEILGNKTCKKILSLLAEKNASESDIASSLGIAINTAEYNIKKLVEAGLIEKAEHWWSVKGKKIPIYKLANKYIIIAPKNRKPSNLKTFIPVILASGIVALIIRYFSINSLNQGLQRTTESDKLIESAPQISGTINYVGLSLWEKILNLQSWEWFLAGALFAIILSLILIKLNNRRKNKNG